MTPRTFYLVGIAVVAGAGGAAGFLIGPEARTGIWAATGLAVGAQGPLGWWLLKSVGAPRCVRVWGLGMLSRFGLLGLMAFVLAPAFGWALAATVAALALLLVALLAVEVAVLLMQGSTTEAQRDQVR